MEGTTFNDYLKELVSLRKKYNEAVEKKDRAKIKEYGRLINYTHYEALVVDGIDVYELRIAQFEKMYPHKLPITEQQMNKLMPAVKEVYYTRDTVELLNRYKTAPSWEKNNIEAEIKSLIKKVYAIHNSDVEEVWEFTAEAMEMYLGHEPTAEEKKQLNTWAKEAMNAVDKMSASAKKKLGKVEQPNRVKKRPKLSPFLQRDRYGETYSGADMVVFMAFPGYKPIEVGVASTVSYTTYREKKQVRTLGRVSAKGITRGPRTISGRLIFTVISEHIVESLRREIPYLRNIKTILMDELPSFDLLISFGNEYGSGAGLVLQGITTVDEQTTMSIEDMFTENIFTYLARYVQPMRDYRPLDDKETYDPLTWFGSDFNPASSESLAKFKPKKLMVYKESLLLADPTPFIGGPSEWDSKSAPTIKGAPTKNVGGTNKKTNAYNTSAKKGQCKVVVNVFLDGSKNRTPVSGAEVFNSLSKKSAKTDSLGNAFFYVSNKETKSACSAMKSGYKTSAIVSGNPKGKSIIYIYIPLAKNTSLVCKGSDKTKVAKSQGTGFWYNKGATHAEIVPYTGKTKKVKTLFGLGKTKTYKLMDLTPRPSIKVMNKCSDPLKNIMVSWSFAYANHSSVKKNKLWHGISDSPPLKAQKTGSLGVSFTNSDGVATLPETSFGPFYSGAIIKVIGTPMSEGRTSVKLPKLKITFYFYLKPKPVFG